MRKAMWALCAMLAISASSQAAVITVFSNNLAGWQAAAGSPVFTETFSGGPLVTGLSILSGDGTVTGGHYNDIVHSPVGTSGDQVTFGFNPNIRAFGGDFDLTPGGAGQGIQFIVTFADNTTQLVSAEVPSSFNGQFFGFVSDTAIKSVQLSGGTQAGTGAQETFNLDNLRFSLAPVPEPISLVVFGGLIVGGAGIAIRRQMAKASA